MSDGESFYVADQHLGTNTNLIYRKSRLAECDHKIIHILASL